MNLEPFTTYKVNATLFKEIYEDTKLRAEVLEPLLRKMYRELGEKVLKVAINDADIARYMESGTPNTTGEIYGFVHVDLTLSIKPNAGGDISITLQGDTSL